MGSKLMQMNIEDINISREEFNLSMSSKGDLGDHEFGENGNQSYHSELDKSQDTQFSELQSSNKINKQNSVVINGNDEQYKNSMIKLRRDVSNFLVC